MSGGRSWKEGRSGGPPLATMRYMPLADIFVGAIACLLILIIVARQSKEQVNKIPQADYVYECSQTSKGLFVRKKLPMGKNEKNDSFSLKQFRKQLFKMASPDRLSVRVLVMAIPKNTRVCRKESRKIIEELNQLYETPGKKSRPASFLLLEVVGVLPNKEDGRLEEQ